MPRDLTALEAGSKGNTDGAPPQLTRSPDEVDAKDSAAISAALAEAPGEGKFWGDLVKDNEKRDELHPYTQTLTLQDVDSCVQIENSTFPPHERATREKFEYRLKTCGQLSMGIYTSAEVNYHNDSDTVPTASTSAPVYTGAPSRKAALLGHILATMGVSETVTDADMALPSAAATEPVGHREEGNTICIHSLAVLPAFQGRGLGKTLLKSYLQRMQGQQVAERIALLAHRELVPFYESVGFENRGESQAQFGGGGWNDMVIELFGENAKATAVFDSLG